ncbi:MAG: HK97 gp10 family phage protein [Cyanobacteria bacterium REEB65]|nr:HK97 gp10 family phage protein [Cyanobacteria bacterium REEB65]
MSDEIIWAGVSEFEYAMDALIAKNVAAVEGALAKGAHMVEAAAKKNSSGPPGPNVVTGSHRRSIHVEGPKQISESIYQAQVGPSMIYSRRLELGFDGKDSLGRVYHQEPRPYLEPAIAEVGPQLEALFTAALMT